jgi:hypothetical protein
VREELCVYACTPDVFRFDKTQGNFFCISQQQQKKQNVGHDGKANGQVAKFDLATAQSMGRIFLYIILK